MATPKRAAPRLVPFVLVSLLTLIFLIWAMRRCNEGDGDYAMVEEQRVKNDYLRQDSLRQDSLRQLAEARLRAEQAAAASVITIPLSETQEEIRYREEALLRARTQPLPGDTVIYLPGQSAERVVVQKQTTLYSTIDGLNVRTQPSLKGKILARLPLYAEVDFMNEVTDSLYEIDLGEITPREPWVKIRLADGKEGWVYGAGVRYYKYRLPGVIN